MIISRTPFRMSFFGGGSDLPAYYEREPGAVLSTSINKYMYINLHKKFDNKMRLAYSRVEEVDCVADIQHPIVRNSLKYFGVHSGLEITSIADIPANGSGLGSSSSYTVGLIMAILAYQKKYMDVHALAELACDVEIKMCGDPIGKQDQFAAAHGGFNIFEFDSNGTRVRPIEMDSSLRYLFGASLVTVYAGGGRSAAGLLREQSKTIESDPRKFAVQRKMVEMVETGMELLVSGDLRAFGELLHESWLLKRSLTNNITDSEIDKIYRIGLDAGAWGGKLLGAGQTGFITFITDPNNVIRLKEALKDYRLVDLLPESSGAQLIHVDQPYN